ncbi:GTP cyclohydrolase I [Propioniciclava flava]
MDVYAKRPQVQERLTTQIADALVEPSATRGHGGHRGPTPVHDHAGVRKPGSRTVASAVGCVATPPPAPRP